MPAVIDITDQRFGRLVVVRQVQTSKPGKHWLCQCDCGNTCIRRTGALRDKTRTNKSCGCARDDSIRKAHAAAIKATTLWSGPHKKHLKWLLTNMKKRCYNQSDTHFQWYGGRGIKICDLWLADSSAFYDWCIANGYHPGLSIERINVDEGYSPDNCTFIPIAEQQRNTTKNRFVSWKGETMCLADWSRKLGIRYGALQHRLDRGWSIDKAFTQELRKW